MVALVETRGSAELAVGCISRRALHHTARVPPGGSKVMGCSGGLEGVGESTGYGGVARERAVVEAVVEPAGVGHSVGNEGRNRTNERSSADVDRAVVFTDGGADQFGPATAPRWKLTRWSKILQLGRLRAWELQRRSSSRIAGEHRPSA